MKYNDEKLTADVSQGAKKSLSIPSKSTLHFLSRPIWNLKVQPEDS
ncbi:hypothetical protein MCEIIB125_01296 [Candidatus Planktophila dulcis]